MYVEDKISHRGPFPIEVTANQTVAELKLQIEKEFEIPTDYQKWILGKELVTNENSTLKDYNITTEGCPVFLYLVAPDPKTKAEKPKSSKIEDKNPPSTSKIVATPPSETKSVKDEKQSKPTPEDEIEKMKINVQNLQKQLNESKNEAKKTEFQPLKLNSPSTKLISQATVQPVKVVNQSTSPALSIIPSIPTAKATIQPVNTSPSKLSTPVTIQQPPVVIDHAPKIINVIPKPAESKPKAEVIIPIVVEEKSVKTEAKPKRVEKPISVTEIKIEETEIQPAPKVQIRDSKGSDFVFPKASSPSKTSNIVAKPQEAHSSKIEKVEPKVNADAPVQRPQRRSEIKEAPKAKEEDMEDYDSKTLKPAKEWECHLCTLLNPTSSNICAVCATVRLTKVQPPKRSSKKKAPQPNPEEASGSKDQTYLQLVNLDNADLVENVETFECVVCFLETPPREGVTLRECLHQFCKACLAQTIEYNDEAEVKCPYRDDDYSCNIALQDREIKALVTPAVYELHLAKSVAQAENKMDKSFHCKTPDCKGWCVFEDNVNEFRCPVCRKINCLTCQAIHMGVNCKQYQERMKEESEIDEDARRTRAMLGEMVARGEAIECPTCKVILMKKWGCDWLRCSMCKTEICWVTRGPRWGPAGKGDTSGGCQCGINGVKCHPKCNYCH